MNELKLDKRHFISENVYNSQTIKDSFLKTFESRTNKILTNIAGLLPTAEHIRDIIDPHKIYVAQFPKDIVEKMQAGQYDLMHSKSGEILSMIIDKTHPKKNIIHNVRLTELDTNVLSKVQDISNNIASLAVQQQLAQVLEELSEVKKIATSIKRGQVTDRIATVNTGKDLLESALNGPSKEGYSEIQHAIRMLLLGRNQLELYLKDELKFISDVPTSKIKIFFKSVFNNGFYDKCNESYNSFQEAFKAYFESCVYLSMAYNEIKDEKAMLKAFETVKSLVQVSSSKILSLSTIAVSGKSEEDLMWYRNPDLILETFDNYQQQTFLKNADVINIEFEGSQLLGEV
ncbi:MULTISPECIES: hypothetical protein [Peribacillus]|uniref:hypothetical protein n=1 Tax=Peribacillus TaxID=2675229 RepID=UPI001F4DBFC2|nr:MULTISPECIES: hypothetical protein [unclassified Peribacillus]MCK1986248.1 hypothetical protein [Peribacillus sp. Aquil_B1]MCK2010395.1 hypothetical protein [Peribacillus sp. Aquil_B8]